MSHPTEDRLLDLVLEIDDDARAHVRACSECAGRVRELKTEQDVLHRHYRGGASKRGPAILTGIAAVLLVGISIWAVYSVAPGDGDKKKKQRPPMPAYFGHDGAWTLNLFVKGKWKSWRTPNDEKIDRASVAISDRFAAVLLRQKGYPGWVFDFKSEKWTEVPKSPMEKKRYILDPRVMKLVGNRIVVWDQVGGDETAGALYDLSTGTWKKIARAPIDGRYRSPATVAGGQVYVWGGYPVPTGKDRIMGAENAPLTDGAVYDPSKNKWKKLPEAPFKFRYGSEMRAWGTRIVIVSMDGRVAAFDPAKWTWKKFDGGFKRGELPALEVINDRLVVWTGVEVHLLDLKSGKWSKGAEAPLTPRSLATMVQIGSTLLVFGGWDPNEDVTFRQAAEYDLAKDRWKKVADMPSDMPMKLHPGW